jgi:hypothetical protein
MAEGSKLPPEKGIKEISVSDEKIISAHKAYLARDKAFFQWWKEGVALAGVNYFGDGTKENLEKAVDKNELRPIADKVEKALSTMGNGEAAFLTAMYCFFNDIRGAELCEKAGVKGFGDLISLDLERREVLAGLTVNYVGW